MELPMRLVCSECGRSLEWSRDDADGPPSSCVMCGGRIEEGTPDSPGSSRPMRTPTSLELTPDDDPTGLWGRGDGGDLPATIGRFRIRELLGGGGFGRVYRAFDSRLDRDVALKVLRDERPPARVIERFFREARAAAQLDHPSIVPIHEAGRDEGRCWIAYQYVPGPTLSRARDDRMLDFRRAVEVIRDLADALDHSHSRGIYHRDVKPANVILDASGRPRLTDFGLARRDSLDPTMTRDGAILGTPAYMSPEAASGNGHRADARSDLYSLGVMLHELLCGRRPADLPSGIPAWRAAANVPPKPLRTHDRKIPRELDRICLRALALNPDDRYPAARTFADDLDGWLRNGTSQPSFARAGWLAAALLAVAFGWEVLDRPRRPPEPAPPPSARGEAAGPALAAIPVRDQSAPEGSAAEAEVGDESVIGNRGSHIIHRKGCASLRVMKSGNSLTFSTAREALDLGFKPHSQCLPDIAAEWLKGAREDGP